MNVKIVSVIFLVLLMLAMVAPMSFAECSVTKDHVMKSIIAYVTNEYEAAGISRGDVVALIKAYLNPTQCNDPAVAAAVNKASQIDDSVVPKCTDGTAFASCSQDRPKYCYAGRLVDRCDLCCDTGVCGSDGRCEVPQTCTDSDGGMNYHLKGYIYWSTQNYKASDVCRGDYLHEYYCDGGMYAETNYLCPYGCADGACLKGPKIVDCVQKYGEGYWCSTYDEWYLECKGTGETLNQGDVMCNGADGVLKSYCSKCSLSNCSQHQTIVPLTTKYYNISVVEKGCTDSLGTEYLIEIKDSNHPICGSKLWVWSGFGSVEPVIGGCYRAEITQDTALGHRITDIGSRIACNGCLDTSSYGKVCSVDSDCSTPLLCKTSGRYDGSVGGYAEKYCCGADECASVMSGPCVRAGGTDVADTPADHIVKTCLLNSQTQQAEYVVDCNATYGEGYWCGTRNEWDLECNAIGDLKDLKYTMGETCSLVPDRYNCVRCG